MAFNLFSGTTRNALEDVYSPEERSSPVFNIAGRNLERMLLSGQTPSYFTPRSSWDPNAPTSIPSYSDWLASNPTTGEAQHQVFDYTSQYYGQQPQDRWYEGIFEAAPLLAGAGVLGAGAFGPGGFLTGAGEAAGGSAPFVAAEGPGSVAALGETAMPAAGGVAPQTFMGGAGPSAAGVELWRTGGGAVTGGTGTIGGSALGRLLGLGQTGQDYLSVAGSVLPSVLGYFGAQKQSDAYKDVANQYLGLGAPFRSRLEASYGPDFDLLSQPGYGSALQRIADMSARSANVKYGNPYDAAAQAQVMNDVFAQNYLPALASYRGQLGQFGGFGLNTAGAGSMGEAGVAGGPYRAIGWGLGNLMNPPEPSYTVNIGGVPVRV